MDTTAILKAHAPELFGGGSNDTILAVNSFRGGHWDPEDYDQVLDAYAQALLKLERAKEALRFYAWRHNDENAGDWLERMEDEYGDKARACLAELGGE